MHGEIKKVVVTLVVMRHFFILPGASRACADFCDPTAVSRIIGCSLGIGPPNAIQGLSRERERYPRYARISYTITVGLGEFEMKAGKGSVEVGKFSVKREGRLSALRKQSLYLGVPQVFMISCGSGVRPRSHQWPSNPDSLGGRRECRHVGCLQ